ncbi:tetratricopeptide repeat protein [Streptomyces synnematoformans]|uniref:Tetratricopeptide repeat protein n=1 Tax=Streptomyces synnematoformans TaxID=415721 RepID=A0ABN2XHS8_9ACTN
MTAHLHPGLVAVTAGPRDDRGRSEFGTGRLLVSGLVLTSRHGVTRPDGTPRPQIEVKPLLGPRGAVRPGEPVAADVLWQGAGDLDAALLDVHDTAGAPWPPGFLPPVDPDWAEPAGNRPVPVQATGMSAAAARGTGLTTETDTVRGSLDPLTYTGSDRYAVDVHSGRPADAHDWSGMSGAALLDDAGTLIGVVAWSDLLYEGRLTAVPVRALLADHGGGRRHVRQSPRTVRAGGQPRGDLPGPAGRGQRPAGHGPLPPGVRHLRTRRPALHRPGRPLGRAQALRGLADVERMAERPASDARDHYQQALALYEEIGDRQGQAQCLRGLGHLHRLAGDYPQAREALSRGHRICQEIADPRSQADLLRGLGDIECLDGRFQAARKAFTEALAMYDSRGITRGRAYALLGHGDTERLDGR